MWILYFVNNDLGQLAYVIPPLAADGLTATVLYMIIMIC
jgi:hypothetical protein